MNATMSLDKIKHHPVMLDQVLSIISPQHGGSFIDCTFGGGGYSEAILKYPETKVFAIDRDKLMQKHALELSKKFTETNGAKFYFIYLPEYHRYIINLNINNNFKNYKKVIKTVESLNIPLIDIHKELFQSHNDPKSFFPFRSFGHYNELGYKMVAKIISNKIKEFEHIK